MRRASMLQISVRFLGTLTWVAGVLARVSLSQNDG